MWRVGTIALTLWSAGCSEYDLRNGTEERRGVPPDILVSPPALVYGELAAGEDEAQTFTVRNIGESTLNVSDVRMGAGPAFTVLTPDVAFDLEPGQAAEIDVAFTPMGADENFGQVLVYSDDPDSPEVPVDLLGYGLVPELLITPASHTFGDAIVPCGDEVELTLENVGREELVITGFDYASGGELVLHGEELRAELPITLPVGGTRTVMVEYTATTAGSDTGMFTVYSNDPRGDVTADQNGEGAWIAQASETFTEVAPPSVDIMLLIDQSGSMEDENTVDVQTGLPDLVTRLQTLSDWRLALVTEEDGCATGGILDPTTPNAGQFLVDNAFTANHGLTEMLLELAGVALSKTGPGQCNEGFPRPGSLLHVITISDEPEQSLQPYDYWLADFATYTGHPSLVAVSAVVDLTGCGDGPAGYFEAATETGGSLLDICGNTWGTQMAVLAEEILAGVRTYQLQDQPDPLSVTVTVNGVPTTDFVVVGDRVTVSDPPIGDGDVVEIHYGLLAECP